MGRLIVSMQEAAEAPSKPAYETAFGRIFVSKPKVVFSRTMKTATGNTRIVADQMVEEVDRLERASFDSGVPFFCAPAELALLASRTIETGLVALRYAVGARA